MMKIIGHRGNPDIATVYIADFDGRLAEFVESRQPPIPWERKWVLILSCSFGCPVNCAICDAGGDFRGHLSAEQIFAQADFLIRRRYRDGIVPVEKFKIQFARMGEPALNDEIFRAMELISQHFPAPGLMFCVSTIAPRGCDEFFNAIAKKKDEFGGKFQLQFSIHSTNENERDFLMPIGKWSLEEIAQYGHRFWRKSDRKMGLNFAVAQGIEISPERIVQIFSPDIFMVKITPVNPTEKSVQNCILSAFAEIPDKHTVEIINRLKDYGFRVILSVGELEENYIGSNCGQFVSQISANYAGFVERPYGKKYVLVESER